MKNPTHTEVWYEIEYRREGSEEWEAVVGAKYETIETAKRLLAKYEASRLKPKGYERRIVQKTVKTEPIL